MILQCNNKFDGDHFCSTPHINEMDLHRWFSQAFSQYYAERDAIIENMRFLRETCFDLDGMQEWIVEIEAELQTAGQIPMGFDPMLGRNIVEKVLVAKAGHRIPTDFCYSQYMRVDSHVSEKTNIRESL